MLVTFVVQFMQAIVLVLIIGNKFCKKKKKKKKNIPCISIETTKSVKT